MNRIETLENEIADLRKILLEKETELMTLQKECTLKAQLQFDNANNHIMEPNKEQNGNRLSKWAIVRYSRQILLPDIGVAGQERLCASKVLVVGAGGLGCPAAVYLAGAGVGEIGIVDYDEVDISNIHRQILHMERDENNSKAASATHKLRSINSHIKVTPYNVQLDASNALEIASRYDVILDCSDNVPTRYLLNDLSVITKIPLISGSALKMEGQLTVYGYRAEKNCNEKEPALVGPCYRCVFPAPPPPAAVGSCSAHGVAGPVPGVIGALQALEAIKLIVGHTHEKLLVGRLLLFDGEDMTFRTVTLRGRHPQCAVCSQTPSITRLIDYELFCKAQAKEKINTSLLVTERRKQEKEKRMSARDTIASASVVEDLGEVRFHLRPYHHLTPGEGKAKCSLVTEILRSCDDLDFNDGGLCLAVGQYDLDLRILPPENRITATQLSERLTHSNQQRHLLVDVRSKAEFNMCKIEGAVNHPIDSLSGDNLEELLEKIRSCSNQVVFICRRGNDSQIAAKKVLDAIEESQQGKITDLAGGLHAWAKDVDKDFPVY